jgi:hypothetical protein
LCRHLLALMHSTTIFTIEDKGCCVRLLKEREWCLGFKSYSHLDTQYIIYYSINCRWSQRCFLVYPALKDNSCNVHNIYRMQNASMNMINLYFACLVSAKYSSQYLHDLCLKLLTDSTPPCLPLNCLFIFVFCRCLVVASIHLPH